MSAEWLDGSAEKYRNDPEFMAERVALGVIEDVLARMEDQAITRVQLAERMGCSRSHISQILRNPTNMRLATMAKLAVAVGLRLKGPHCPAGGPPMSLPLTDVRPSPPVEVCAYIADFLERCDYRPTEQSLRAMGELCRKAVPVGTQFELAVRSA